MNDQYPDQAQHQHYYHEKTENQADIHRHPFFLLCFVFYMCFIIYEIFRIEIETHSNIHFPFPNVIQKILSLFWQYTPIQLLNTRRYLLGKGVIPNDRIEKGNK